jgi:hypothetical protein
MCADVIDGMARDEIGYVALFLHEIIVAPEIELAGAAVVRVVVDVAGLEAEEIIVAMLARRLVFSQAKVPFADERRGVTSLLKQQRQRMIRGGQPGAPSWIGGWQGYFDAVALLVSARNEAGACRRADGSIAVEIGEAPPCFARRSAQRADVRCAMAEIAIANIVSHMKTTLDGAVHLRRRCRT